MFGAIIGDIVGSRFEFHNIKSKDFTFFSERCHFTDDSVMSIALAKAIVDCDGNYDKLEEFAVKEMQEFGRRYPHAGYGGNFKRWVFSEDPKPYGSFGNGAAMRVSACGFAAKTIEEAKLLSRKVTEVTHNHPDGIRGAEATAVAIFLAKSGKSKDEIRDYIDEHYYNVSFSLDLIRPKYHFFISCMGTVPFAIVAFLESNSFEDAIRNAISIGGDSDTIAAICGGIAEAFYGIDQKYKDGALSYLDEYLATNLLLLDDIFSK